MERRRRDPRRHGDGHRGLGIVANRRPQSGDRCLEPSRDLARPVERRAGKQNRELVAAVPTDDVAAAQPVLEDTRDRPQHIVALELPVRFVHARQVVDVDEHE